MEAQGLLFVSAQPPKRDGGLIATGIFGVDVDETLLSECLTQCAANVLGHLASIDGGIDGVRGIVRSVVYVVASHGMPIDWCTAPVRRMFALPFGGDRSGAFVLAGAQGLPGGAPCVVETLAKRRRLS